MKKFLHRLQHLPIAYTGLALGVGGLGNCLFQLSDIGGYNGRWITCISISIVILFIFFILIRNLSHPKVFYYELNEPLSISLLPTFSMCLMLISGFIGCWDKSQHSANQIAAATVMCIAIFIQFVLIGFFIKNIVVNHIKSRTQHMYGSYFVPVVGLITACTVSSNITSLPNEFFQAIWYIGYITFVVTLPIITYSILFKDKKVSNDQFPTLAIWFAPANLSCAGFLQVFMLDKRGPLQNHSSWYSDQYLFIMLCLMIMIGFATSLLLYLYIVRIFSMRIKSNSKIFTPILCSLSFPCAIGATSMVWTSRILKQRFYNSNLNNINVNELNDLFESLTWFFAIIGIIFAALTTIIITYLLFNMILFGIKTLFTSSKDNSRHNVYLT